MKTLIVKTLVFTVLTAIGMEFMMIVDLKAETSMIIGIWIGAAAVMIFSLIDKMLFAKVPKHWSYKADCGCGVRLTEDHRHMEIDISAECDTTRAAFDTLVNEAFDALDEEKKEVKRNRYTGNHGFRFNCGCIIAFWGHDDYYTTSLDVCKDHPPHAGAEYHRMVAEAKKTLRERHHPWFNDKELHAVLELIAGNLVVDFECGCKVTFIGDSAYLTSRMDPGILCKQHTMREQTADRDELIKQARSKKERWLAVTNGIKS